MKFRRGQSAIQKRITNRANFTISVSSPRVWITPWNPLGHHLATLTEDGGPVTERRLPIQDWLARVPAATWRRSRPRRTAWRRHAMRLDFDFGCNARSWFDVMREGGRTLDARKRTTAHGAHLVWLHLMRTRFERTWYLLWYFWNK